MLELLALPWEEQARHCGLGRRRWKDGYWARSGQHSLAARRLLGDSQCTDYLCREGFSLHFSSRHHRMGPVRFRACLSLSDRSLLVYESAITEVARALERLNASGGLARELILAHETFHVLCPRCPSALAELSAHRFASELLPLPFFAGLVDLACAP